MIYAFKAGPLERIVDRTYAYIGVRDDGELTIELASRDRDGLAALVESAGGEQEARRCEPRLAKAGLALGFVADDLPAWARLPAAHGAMIIALGERAPQGGPAAFDHLLRGAAELWRGKPWRHWTDGEAAVVTARGAIEARFELSIMGNAGLEFGFALYRRPGALARIGRAMDRGRPDLARREDCIAVTYDDHPRFAITRLRDAYGLTRLPVPVVLDGGAMRPAAPSDVAILSTAMHAVAMLAPGTGRGHATVELSRGPLVVEAFAPGVDGGGPAPTLH